MKPRTTLVVLWLASAILSAALLVPALLRSAAARASVQSAALAQSRAQAAATRIAETQRALPAWARGEAPALGLSQRLSALLAATGLPPSTLLSLSADGNESATPLLTPDADATTGDAALAPDASSHRLAPVRLVRRRASVSLSGLTLPQLGSLLARWRSDAPEWVVTSIDVTPIDAPPPALTAGASSASATHTPRSADGPPRVGGDLPLRGQLSAELLALSSAPESRSAASSSKTTRPRLAHTEHAP